MDTEPVRFLCQKPWKDRFFVPRVRLFLGTLKFFAVLKRIFRLPFNKHLIILESKFNACTLRISALFGTVKNICSICEYLTVTDENNQRSLQVSTVLAVAYSYILYSYCQQITAGLGICSVAHCSFAHFAQNK